MAIYNEILSARYARMIQKLFSMKGPVPVKQLAGEIMPVLDIFNGVENRYLEGWNRYMQWFQVPAQGAGNAGVVRLRNPSGSGVTIVVESVLVVNIAAASDTPTIQHGPTAADFASIVTGIVNRLDARIIGNASVIASQGTLGANTIGGNKRMIGLPPQNNTSVFSGEMIATDDQEITVLPGDAMQVVSALANVVAPTASIIWRERSLEDSEKT